MAPREDMSGDSGGYLARRFEENRKHLRSVAYRMLGSFSEADDAVQEAWLRLSRSDASGIDNLGGWLTTVVARVSLDMLRARRSRRDQPESVRIPDPIVDPEHDSMLADSVSLALLVVLETLDPAERLALVLHDMFDVSFEEISALVGKTPAAARQLASRARRRVQGAEHGCAQRVDSHLTPAVRAREHEARRRGLTCGREAHRGHGAAALTCARSSATLSPRGGTTSPLTILPSTPAAIV